METYHLDRDIKVFGIKAATFPDGVLRAHQQLHGLLPQTDGRAFFGISHSGGKGSIIYYAAVAEAHAGEAEQYGCESFLLKKGTYISTLIRDFRKDIPAIGRAFQSMLTHADIDSQGYAVEEYVNDTDVRCMVRLEKGERSEETGR